MPGSKSDAEWEPLFEPVDEVPSPAERDAIRAIWLAIAGISLVLIAGVIAAVVRHVEDDGRATEESVPPTGGIGPRPGQPIAEYVAGRQAALAAIGEAERRVAVVTFTRYRNEAEAQEAIDRVLSPGSVEVLARLVAVGGDQPQVVAGSLAEWAAAYRANAVKERDEIAQLIPTVEPGTEFAAFYADEVARLDAVIAGADPAEPVVYGLAVRGPVRALRVLAATSTVRLVDVGDTDNPPDDDVYRGPMPDEVTTIGDPQRRPVPAR